jgi:hypothetical protein
MPASIGGPGSACSAFAGDLGETGDWGGGDWVATTASVDLGGGDWAAAAASDFSASAMLNDELGGRDGKCVCATRMKPGGEVSQWHKSWLGDVRQCEKQTKDRTSKGKHGMSWVVVGYFGASRAATSAPGRQLRTDPLQRLP